MRWSPVKGPLPRSLQRGGSLQQSRPRDRRGSILIIALGVLTLLSILGIAFASLMRLERKAAENYVDGKRMDLLLDSALDRVIASLHGAKNWRSFTVYQDTPWLNLLGDGRRGGGGERDLAHGRADIDDPRVGRWELFSQEEGQRGSYKTKVIDCASQINLNGRQDTMARILDNLGQAIERSSRLKLDGKNKKNPFFEGPDRTGNQVKGEDIVRFRRLLPEGRFTTKAQIRWLIGQENYENLRDFVTCYSWEDPYTYKPTDGLDQVSIFRGVTSTGGGGLGGGGAVSRQPAASGTPRVDSEPRFPININTAPEEVLIACLQGLAGRRVFPYSKLGSGGGGMVPIDQNAQVVGERIFGNEEIQNVTPRAIFVYGPRLEYEHAQRIAVRIISQRKVKPFMAWRTNDIGLPGFEDFVDTQLDTGFFPAAAQSLVIDPEQTQNRQIESDVLNNATSLVGQLWRRGHDNRERQIRRQKGMLMHDLNAWYYEMIKGVLKANFNPNTRLNRYNPNAPAYNPVDKSDLVWAQTRQEIFKGHTTEFCFDTMGFYEITTLGRYEPVTKRQAEQPRTSTGSRGPISSAMQTEQIFVRPFDRKTRTIVKTFDVLRHTNQFHFERTFTSQARSSKNDRKYVVTHPEPMAALTELYSHGSLRDGRVELAGLLDGERLQVDVRSRSQLYRTHPSVLMAHGFQDRDSTSITRLQRVLRQGGGVSLLGDEVSSALKDVFDANYSRLQSINARFIRRTQLVSLGGVLSSEAIASDPLVQREVLGNDLQPDGLHTSILRTSHLQMRHLVLPSRQPLGQSGQFGGGNPAYGSTGIGSRGQNIVGNVPYHRGGLAFWVKFDFNARDPVFSGLIGCTSVIKEVSPNPTDWRGSEGVQFFIFKNSEGFLRVTRMYYHQAFYTSGGEGGGGGDSGGGGVQLYPDALAAEGGLGSNPIQDNLDPKKIISRSDIILDIRHIRAHEWHHIAVDWDDQTNPTFPIRLYLDFQEVREGGTPRRAQAEVSGTANSWVRLNERQPRDGLQVGGIIRNQGVADAGLFKWFTNTTSTGSGGGITTVAQSVKRIIANATIDELITYDGDFTGAKQYYAASGSPGYFTTQVGEYANLFEVPLSPNVDSVVLRSIDWTSYYPVMFTDSRPSSVPVQVRVTPINCQMFYLANTPAPANFQEPWRQPSVVNQIAGRRAFRSRTGLEGRNVEVVYKFSLSGARSNAGNTAGGVVQTPSVDDVTLTYYLSSPKILVQEELD